MLGNREWEKGSVEDEMASCLICWFRNGSNLHKTREINVHANELLFTVTICLTFIILICFPQIFTSNCNVKIAFRLIHFFEAIEEAVS